MESSNNILNSQSGVDILPSIDFAVKTENLSHRHPDFFRGGSPVRMVQCKLEISDITGSRPRIKEIAPLKGRDYLNYKVC